jgi:hypothetical protein
VPGGPAITVSGTRISLALGATAIAIGTSSESGLGTFAPSTDPTSDTGTSSSASGTAMAGIVVSAATQTAIKKGGAGRVRCVDPGAMWVGILAAVLAMVCGRW